MRLSLLLRLLLFLPVELILLLVTQTVPPLLYHFLSCDGFFQGAAGAVGRV